MKLLPLIALIFTMMLGLAGCGGVDQTPVNADELAPIESVEIDSQSQGLCPHAWPPRCGPRNCVAMCVTCFRDICAHSGGTCQECAAEMELCKEECNEGQECRPGDPCDPNFP